MKSTFDKNWLTAYTKTGMESATEYAMSKRIPARLLDEFWRQYLFSNKSRSMDEVKAILLRNFIPMSYYPLIKAFGFEHMGTYRLYKAVENGPKAAPRFRLRYCSLACTFMEDAHQFANTKNILDFTVKHQIVKYDYIGEVGAIKLSEIVISLNEFEHPIVDELLACNHSNCVQNVLLGQYL